MLRCLILGLRGGCCGCLLYCYGLGGLWFGIDDKEVLKKNRYNKIWYYTIIVVILLYG